MNLKQKHFHNLDEQIISLFLMKSVLKYCLYFELKNLIGY
jgi:uncharacterized membrane protein (DUF485 family)